MVSAEMETNAEMVALVVMALAAYCLYFFAVAEAVQDSDAINITFNPWGFLHQGVKKIFWCKKGLSWVKIISCREYVLHPLTGEKAISRTASLNFTISQVNNRHRIVLFWNLILSLLCFLLQDGLLFTHCRSRALFTSTIDGSSLSQWQNIAISSSPMGLDLVPLNNKTLIKYLPLHLVELLWIIFVTSSFLACSYTERLQNKKREPHIEWDFRLNLLTDQTTQKYIFIICYFYIFVNS